jgi:hypothetical protein
MTGKRQESDRNDFFAFRRKQIKSPFLLVKNGLPDRKDMFATY